MVQPWPGRSGGPSVKRYDFRRPDKFSKDQLRTLQIIHESFARGASTSLSGYVRTVVEGEVVSVTQASYDDFIRSLANPTLMAVFGVSPLEGSALLEIPPDLSFVIIDRLLGGPGTLPGRVRELTEIEQTVMSRIIEQILGDFGDAWTSLVDMEPKLDRIEVNPSFVQLLPPHDMVIVIALRIKVRGVEGRVNICMPYAALEPVAPNLSAHYLFGSGQKVEAGKHVDELRHRVETMHVDVAVGLGETTVTVGELLGLADGDVVKLDTRTGESLVVRVGERTKFYGKPGRVGSRLAVEITDVIPGEGEEDSE